MLSAFITVVSVGAPQPGYEYPSLVATPSVKAQGFEVLSPGASCASDLTEQDIDPGASRCKKCKKKYGRSSWAGGSGELCAAIAKVPSTEVFMSNGDACVHCNACCETSGTSTTPTPSPTASPTPSPKAESWCCYSSQRERHEK